MLLLDELARRQYGLVSRRQAVDRLGTARLRRAVATGQLVAVGRGVFRCAGVPMTFRQRAMAACLAYGPPVAISHSSAAVLWGYELVVPLAEIEVSVPPSRSGRLPGIRAHRVAINPTDIDQRFGLVVTCPGRTLLDLAGRVSAAVLERCLDDALRSHQATAAGLLQWLQRVDRHSRHGSAQLRRLLDLRISSGVGDSAGVDRVHRWIIRAGLPAPVLGFSVVVAGRQRLLDLAYPVQKLAIEFNGWEYHQMRSRMDADHARTTELELAGWLVIVVTAAHNENDTVDRIYRALAQRAAAPAPPGQSVSWSGMLGP